MSAMTSRVPLGTIDVNRVGLVKASGEKKPELAKSRLKQPTKVTNFLSSVAPDNEESFPVHHVAKEAKNSDGVLTLAELAPLNTKSKGDDAAKPESTNMNEKGTSAGPTTRSRTATAKTVAPKAAAASARKPAAASTMAKKPPIPTHVPVGTKRNISQVAESSSEDGKASKKKRAAWDLKGRLQDMEEDHALLRVDIRQYKENVEEIEGKLANSEDKVTQLENFRRDLESQLRYKETENMGAQQEIMTLRNQLQQASIAHQGEVQEIRAKYTSLTRDLEDSLGREKRAKESLEQELTICKSENVQLRSTISSQAALNMATESEKAALKIKNEQLEQLVKRLQETQGQLELKLSNAQEEISKLENKARQDETLRRKLHNTIQELKGNIRVFCRVRPPLEAELQGRVVDNFMHHIQFPSDSEGKEIEIVQTSDNFSGSKVVKSNPFSFDKVFQPSTSQVEVFEEISQLVQSALDGYRVCIFAYGQTGSGKTFTMEGPPGITKLSIPCDPETLSSREALDSFVGKLPDGTGMIPRAVLQIFLAAQQLQSKGWKYSFEASFLEIYNESLRDLLSTDSKDKKHEIKHDAKTGTTIVTDLSVVEVKHPAQVMDLLRVASTNRAVAETQCNERSSRSHSIFTLKLTGENSITEEKLEGMLHLIDLAGSERLSMSGSTGDRLKETQAINKSLSSLGDVIASLANKDAHVPFRNSKLTYLLQHSLGGNSKTLMFVNVSPTPEACPETICSLRFATKVNSCQIGTASARKGAISSVASGSSK